MCLDKITATEHVQADASSQTQEKTSPDPWQHCPFVCDDYDNITATPPSPNWDWADMLNTSEIRKNKIIRMLKCLLLSRGRWQDRRDHPFLSTRGLMVGEVKDKTCSNAFNQGFALDFSSSRSKEEAKEEIWTWGVKSCSLELHSANLEMWHISGVWAMNTFPCCYRSRCCSGPYQLPWDALCCLVCP